MLKIGKLMQNEQIINSQTSNKMNYEKNPHNDVGILFLIILIGVAIFETNSHAATPFEQVEEAVGGGAIYMNVDGIETTYAHKGIFWEEIDDPFPANEEDAITEFLDKDISYCRASRAEE